MTRKELKRFLENGLVENVKSGYCCLQKDGVSRLDCIEVGTNSGVYGWNWTLWYYPDTRTAYIDGYRNF